MLGFAQLCGLGFHRPGDAVVTNGSLAVSRCARCRKEIIRQDGQLWRTTPPRTRVVWRQAETHEMTWPIQDVY